MSGCMLLPACAGACVLLLALAIEKNATSEEHKSAWGTVRQQTSETKQVGVPGVFPDPT